MLIPRLRPAFNHKELFAAFAWWRGGVVEFERAFEKKFSVKHATAFSYGRTGLYALLKSLGLQGDEVICPAYTCVVVPHAIVLSGNTPVFVDCGEKDFNMSLDGIGKSITSKTKAVIVTHLFGYPMNCERIQEIVSKWDHKIYLIHDCAHSFGAKWNGRYVWEYGDAAFFGFGIGKLMTSLYGGMVTTSDDRIYGLLTEERRSIENKSAGISKSLGRLLYLVCVTIGFHPRVYPLVNWIARKTPFLKGWTDYYRENKIEFPKDAFDPMLGIEGRVGCVQLDKYDSIVCERRAKASIYAENIDMDGARGVLREGATYSHFPVIVNDKNGIRQRYIAKRVELGELIEYSMPEMPAYLQYRAGEYPRAGHLSRHIVNLPIWKGVKADVVEPSLKTYTFDYHWQEMQGEKPSTQKMNVAAEFLKPGLGAMMDERGSVRVLDAGCGDGIHCAYMHDLLGSRINYTGIDISKSCVERLRGVYKQAGNMEFHVGDVCELPYEDKSFDVVFSYGVIGYTDSPRQAFNEMCRVLKDGGRIGLWVYPRRSGVGGFAFRQVRRICEIGGPRVARIIAGIVVPFLPILPTASKVHLGNSTWKECQEVVLVNIAPKTLHFFQKDELLEWCRADGVHVDSCDEQAPLTLWGTKVVQ